jgi:hypothetical protein
VSFGDEIKLDAFLRDFPLMSVRPSRTVSGIVIKGTFAFTARSVRHGELTDQYKLQIVVPPDFPRSVPRVTELENKIPRQEGFHVNPDDSLCLGSPLRLLLMLNEAPTLPGFADSCLIPFLFGISHKLRHGGKLPFDELAHGVAGLLADYVELFHLRHPRQVLNTLRVLGMKKRRANKKPCPCDCGLRLGKCNFNRTVARFRAIREIGRPFYRAHAQQCEDQIVAAIEILAKRRNLIQSTAVDVVRVDT